MGSSPVAVKNLIFENYYKRIGFSKESIYHSMKRLNNKYLLLLTNKLIKNIPVSHNGKEHYKSFIIKEKRKFVKKSEMITYQQRIFQNPNIFYIKSIITEHPKTSHKLSKTIRQAEKVSSNSPLYSDTKKLKIFWMKKDLKITKQEHACKGYASTYKVEILNSFNSELQLKDTEHAIKSNII